MTGETVEITNFWSVDMDLKGFLSMVIIAIAVLLFIIAWEMLKLHLEERKNGN